MKKKHSFLKVARQRLGLTQAALAERLGYAPNTIARMERGEISVPPNVVDQMRSWTSGPSARLPIPNVPTIDPFHSDIVARLGGYIDPAVFELCACDLLQGEWPTLVPITGGSDDGFDGAVASTEGTPRWPLIATTGADPVANLARSLGQAIRTGHEPQAAIFATPRALSPKLQTKLIKAAAERNVNLVQIYEQSWFATALYRAPEWCKRLLDLSGTPSALSKLPPSPRPLITSEMIGRAEELEKLRNGTRDAVVLGGPGSGKTMLTYQLVDHGYFLWGDDPTAVANSIRKERPGLVIVDDAHDHLAQLDLLQKVRRQLGATFRIVATTWPPYAPQVHDRLIDAEEFRLHELDADRIAEVVRGVAKNVGNPLIRHIVRQAEGRPGLAAVLARLVVTGGIRAVITGDALYAQVQTYAKADTTLLGCFALGGDLGLSIDAVAAFLKRSADGIQRSLTHLAEGGILRVGRDKRFSVWPTSLRHVLVREVFFGPSSGLAYELLLEVVPDGAVALEALIGATRSGATIHGLVDKLEAANQAKLWLQYAYLDPSTASYVLKHHRDLLLEIVPALLQNVPDRTVLALLDTAADSKDSKALDELDKWLRHSSNIGEEIMDRTRCAIRQILKWETQNTKSQISVLAFCAAMSPNFEYSDSDPGRGMTITITHGVLGGEALRELSSIWSSTAPQLMNAKAIPWKPIFRMLRGWAHPDPTVGIDRDLRTFMRATAATMLKDLLGWAQGHAGVVRRLDQEARALGVKFTIPRNSDFDALFPELKWTDVEEYLEISNKAQKSARRWAKGRLASNDAPEVVVGQILALQRMARDSGAHVADYTDDAFEEVARNSSNLTDWVDAMVTQSVDPRFVWHFVLRQVQTREQFQQLLPVLREPPYLSVAAAAIVSTANAAPEAHDWVVSNALQHLDAVAGQCRVGRIHSSIVNRLLSHSESQVRADIALACYIHSPEGIGDDLKTLWRKAIIETARADDSRSQTEHWLKELLLKDHELAYDWLKAFLDTEQNFSRFEMIQIALEIASYLPSEKKASLLRRAPFRKEHSNVLNHLVDGDASLYVLVLDRIDLKDLWLVPLAPRHGTFSFEAKGPFLRGTWQDLVQLALNRDLPEEDIGRALLSRHHHWAGSELPLWEEWRDRFSRGRAHRDPAVRRIAREGIKLMDERLVHATETERLEAVRGIS